MRLFQRIESNVWVIKVKEAIQDTLKFQKSQSVSHLYDHFERVYKRSVKLAEQVVTESGTDIDYEVLAIAALLHDIDQPFHDKEHHVTKSVNKAVVILRTIHYPSERVQKVLEIIQNHSSEDESVPTSEEGKILFDADKLDGLGAIGIARVFALCGQRGLSLRDSAKWYRTKIAKALPMMQTRPGKKLVNSELEFVKAFLYRFENEQRCEFGDIPVD